MDMSKICRVRAVSAKPTRTGAEGGIDVDFVMTLKGVEHSGEVTLRPYHGFGSWGQPDHWVDGRTLDILRGLDDSIARYALLAIEAATEPAARTEFDQIELRSKTDSEIVSELEAITACYGGDGMNRDEDRRRLALVRAEIKNRRLTTEQITALRGTSGPLEFPKRARI